MSEQSGSSGGIQLPAGVSVGAGRETSELNAQGAVVQGMKWPITLNDGTTSSVFIPNSELHNPAKVTETFANKAKALKLISG